MGKMAQPRHYERRMLNWVTRSKGFDQERRTREFSCSCRNNWQVLTTPCMSQQSHGVHSRSPCNWIALEHFCTKEWNKTANQDKLSC